MLHLPLFAAVWPVTALFSTVGSLDMAISIWIISSRQILARIYRSCLGLWNAYIAYEVLNSRTCAISRDTSGEARKVPHSVYSVRRRSVCVSMHCKQDRESILSNDLINSSKVPFHSPPPTSNMMPVAMFFRPCLHGLRTLAKCCAYVGRLKDTARCSVLATLC